MGFEGEVWRLMRQDELVGEIAIDEAEFPWLSGRFVPAPSFADVKPWFDAQQNFRAYGACDQRGRRFARLPADDEPVAAGWRPIDPAADFFEDWRSEVHRPWPDDRSVLCWWLPSFWGAPEAPRVTRGWAHGDRRRSRTQRA
jgi:hypothetical protein